MEMAFVGAVAVLGLGFALWAGFWVVMGWLSRSSSDDLDLTER